MSEPKGSELDSLEEEVFKVLGHQKRRDILIYMGERRRVTNAFNE